jgi:hypothetical protein
MTLTPGGPTNGGRSMPLVVAIANPRRLMSDNDIRMITVEWTPSCGQLGAFGPSRSTWSLMYG